MAKKNVDISIVIPSYKAELFIGRALEALLAQTLPAEKFEVIVIDDASPDGTMSVLESFKDKIANYYFESLVQNSGGPVVPRNRGIELAQGDYIFFHDADDYLIPTALASFIDFARQTDADVIIPKMKGENGRSVPASQFKDGTIISGEFLKNSMTWNLNPIKLFKRHLINQYHIRFIEDAPVFEDHVFVVDAMLHSKRISILDGDGYYVATYHEGNHLSISNWSKAPSDLYSAVDIILGKVKDNFYLSGIQQARWSTAILRRHLKQLEDKIQKYPVDRSEQMVAEMKRIVLKYASSGWITLFPRAYHEFFKLLITMSPEEIVIMVKQKQVLQTKIDNAVIQHSAQFRKVNYFTNDLFVVLKNNVTITDKNGDVYQLNKNDIIPTFGLEWDEYGWPLLKIEYGTTPLLQSAIEVPDENLRRKIPAMIKKITKSFIYTTDATIINHQDSMPVVGTPLTATGLYIRDSDVYIKTNIANVKWDDEIVFVRDDIELYILNNVKYVRAKTTLPFYKTTTFKLETQTGEHIESNRKIAIESIVYTKGGTPRLKTNKGYLTANKKFVTVVGKKNSKIQIIK